MEIQRDMLIGRLATVDWHGPLYRTSKSWLYYCPVFHWLHKYVTNSPSRLFCFYLSCGICSFESWIIVFFFVCLFCLCPGILWILLDSFKFIQYSLVCLSLKSCWCIHLFSKPFIVFCLWLSFHFMPWIILTWCCMLVVVDYEENYWFVINILNTMCTHLCPASNHISRKTKHSVKGDRKQWRMTRGEFFIEIKNERLSILLKLSLGSQALSTNTVLFLNSLGCTEISPDGLYTVTVQTVFPACSISQLICKAHRWAKHQVSQGHLITYSIHLCSVFRLYLACCCLCCVLVNLMCAFEIVGFFFSYRMISSHDLFNA